MKRNRIIAAIATAGIFLSACGGSGMGAQSGEESGGRSATAEGIKDGGTLYVLTFSEGASSLDPQRVYTGVELGAYGSTYARTLTSYVPAAGKDGASIMADMATDLGTASEDLMTWTFTLRDGITWEDGSDVTCADFAYGISRTFAAEVTAAEGPMYATTYLDIAEGDSDFGSAYPGPWLATPEQQALFDDAVACDGKTITFHLKVPVADFSYTVSLLAFGPVPQAQDTADQYALKPFSNGPFRIETYEEGKEMVMVRNENWNQDSDPVRKPHVDKIIWQYGLEEAVIDERMIADSGDDKNSIVDGGIQTENLPTVFGDDGFKDRRTDGFDGFVSYTMFNNEKVNCLELRQAIWLALDREAIRTAAGGPFTGEFATSFVAPLLATDYAPAKLVDGINESGAPNIEAAQAKLDEAKKSCPDLVARATGEGLRFDHIESASMQKVMPIWIDSLGKIGVNIIDNALESSKYYATINGDRGDIMRAGWAADWGNASTVIPELFGKGGGFNYTNNESDPNFAAFNDKVNAAKTETDRAKQSVMWKELNQEVIDNVWAFPGSATKAQNLVGSNVRLGYQWLPFGWYNLGAIGLAG
jgi:peptide/nickel transport system substrate-binding protein